MYPNAFIEEISVINFRNHKNFFINNLKPFVVLNGENGSGKTNILEAISLFSPGKGLKNASLRDMPNKYETEKGFQIKINLKYDAGKIELKKSFFTNNKKDNLLLSDNEKINQSELLNFINILWITPIMEKVMLQSNSEKRNFFDRLIFNLNRSHLKLYSVLQKLLRERLAILQNTQIDNEWLNTVEAKISNSSYEIIQNRNQFIVNLNSSLKMIDKPFTTCLIEFRHDISKIISTDNKNTFVESYKSYLVNTRKIDAELNKTSHNISKVSIDIWSNIQDKMEIKNCSTGEQKSALLSIFISVAKLIKEQNDGRSPILLIDEATAHLDQNHRDFLFEELKKLNSQVWFTGVSKNLFENISDQTVFHEIENNI